MQILHTHTRKFYAHMQSDSYLPRNTPPGSFLPHPPICTCVSPSVYAGSTMLSVLNVYSVSNMLTMLSVYIICNILTMLNVSRGIGTWCTSFRASRRSARYTYLRIPSSICALDPLRVSPVIWRINHAMNTCSLMHNHQDCHAFNALSTIDTHYHQSGDTSLNLSGKVLNFHICIMA